MRKVLMIIWLLNLGTTLNAQNYQTQAGRMEVSGRYKGESAVAVSNQMNMYLNYERAELQLNLMVPSLFSKNDSLNMLLNKLNDYELKFTGKMNISFVKTDAHPKQKFTTNGMLELNGVSRAVNISSVLEHFPWGNASCILSGRFIVNLKQFNINTFLPGEEKIVVKFNQVVLKKPGEL